MKATISALTGTRESVVAALVKDSAPQSVKDFAAALIAALPSEFNGCRVDAHGGEVAGMLNYQVTVKPLKLAV